MHKGDGFPRRGHRGSSGRSEPCGHDHHEPSAAECEPPEASLGAATPAFEADSAPEDGRAEVPTEDSHAKERIPARGIRPRVRGARRFGPSETWTPGPFPGVSGLGRFRPSRAELGGFGREGFLPDGPSFEGLGLGAGRGPGPRGQRRRRGNVRLALLALLDQEPQHGYALMAEMARRSGGMWRPSPGSVYPVLAQLQDEGMVEVDAQRGRRVYRLSETGRAYVEQHAEDLDALWQPEPDGFAARFSALMKAGSALAGAVHEVARVGNENQARRTLEVLTAARASIYAILSDSSLNEAATSSTHEGQDGNDLAEDDQEHHRDSDKDQDSEATAEDQAQPER